jgi:hypothetical protein
VDVNLILLTLKLSFHNCLPELLNGNGNVRCSRMDEISDHAKLLLSLQLQNGAAPVKGSLESGQKEVKKSPLAKDSLDKMLKDLFSTRDQMATDVSAHVFAVHGVLGRFISCLLCSSYFAVLVLTLRCFYPIITFAGQEHRSRTHDGVAGST